jgi:hypothetical protein
MFKLAQSSAFRETLLRKFIYVVEPTGAASPSQNGAMEIYNDKLAIKVCMLLYMSSLPPKLWPAMLLHSVYLHNWLVHTATQKTPFEGNFGIKLDLSFLNFFGAWVCIKCTSTCRVKLDHHNFMGIFLGYSSSDQNICYLDLNYGIVKTCHHAQFGEAWYLQHECPPGPHLL